MTKKLTALSCKIAFALGMLTFAPSVHAQDAVTLEGDVKVERTVVENETTTTFLEEPASVVPGDRLRFTTSYRNQSSETVDNFVVTNPIPSAVALSEDDNEMMVSVDGGVSYGNLASLTVPADTGEERAATLRDVTHVRWVLAELAPGAAGSLSYYGIVR